MNKLEYELIMAIRESDNPEETIKMLSDYMDKYDKDHEIGSNFDGK